MINYFSIRTKIVLAFLLVIFICVITIFINFFLLDSLSYKINYIINSVDLTERAAFDLQTSFQEDIRAIEEYGNGFTDLEETEKIMQEAETKIASNIKIIEDSDLGHPRQLELLKDLLKKNEVQDERVFELKKLSIKNPTQKTTAFDLRQALISFDQANEEVDNTLDGLIDEIQAHKKAYVAKFEDSIKTSKLYIGAAFVGSILISISLALLTAFSLSDSIKKIRDAALKFSKGDLSKRVVVSTQDEIGELANVFNLMADSINKSSKDLISGKTDLDQKIKESERRAYQAEVLKELNERMGYSLDLAKIIEIITGSVGRLLEYNVIAYMTQSQEKVLFKCELKDPVNHAFVADIKSKMLEAFSAMLNKKLELGDVDESITGAIFSDDIKEPVNSFFNLPLIIGEKVVGVITVASIQPGLYNEEDTAILYTITTQASTAVTKLNEVLEREKGKLNSLVATLDDGVVMLDPHWNLLVINTQARKLLELPEGEVGVFDMLDKLSGKIDIRTKIEKAVAKQEIIAPSEITLGGKIIEVVILQVKDKDNENLGAVVVFHDVTKDRQARNVIEEEVKERTKQLKEEQLKLRASIDSLNVGFFIANPNAEIIMINPVAKRILCSVDHQHPRGVMVDAKAVAECKMADIEMNLKAVFDLRAQITLSIKQMKPIEFKNLEFENLFLHIYISPIVITEQKLTVIGAVVLVEDITEAKVMERSKDEFFSIASHELRTPLTAIRGNTSMIKQFYAEQLKDPDLKNMVDDIHTSSIRLIEIVNDFLDVSRLEQGKIEYKKEAFDANGLVSEVVKELTDIATEKKVYIKTIPGVKLPLVFADRNKIKQVLLNLAGNSIKFTETGGVSISLGVEGKDFIKVSITDTGRGIPIANQALLFHKFQQAGSSLITRDTTKGTGLGLYISKLMIEGMGGKIGLEKSVEGKGSTFVFTMPVASTSVSAPAPVKAVNDKK